MLEAKAKYAEQMSKYKIEELDAEADIAEAKELPKPDVSRMEFKMKDENIRNTIMETRDDVKKLEERMIRMEDKIDKLR